MFDFSALGFIQFLIRKTHVRRACFVLTRKRLTTNEHEWTLIKAERITDYASSMNIVGRLCQTSRGGSNHGSHGSDGLGSAQLARRVRAARVPVWAASPKHNSPFDHGGDEGHRNFESGTQETGISR